MRAAITTWWACAVGCLSSAEKGANDSFPVDAASTTTTDETSVTGGSPTYPRTPTYYTLEGSLALVAGQVDAGRSSVSVAFWSQDVKRLCLATLPLLAATDVLPLADEEVPVVGWWRLQFDAGTDCATYEPLIPSTPSVGIGAYDPLLDPATLAEGYDPEWLYGLYLQPEPGDPTLVYGVAGTEGNLQGNEAPVEVPPLPDGSYTLVALHLLPL